MYVLYVYVQPHSHESDYTIYTVCVCSTSGNVSVLRVDGIHFIASGEYECLAMNPAGNVSATSTLMMSSAIDTQYLPSLTYAAISVTAALILGKSFVSPNLLILTSQESVEIIIV